MSRLTARRPLVALTLGLAATGACLEPGAQAPEPDAAAPAAVASTDAPFPCGRFGHVEITDGKVMKDDMMLGREDELPGLCDRAAQEALYSFGYDISQRKWPGGVVPYRIRSTVPSDLYQRILQAIYHWQNHTPIQFTTYIEGVHDDWVEFSTDTRCHAELGRRGGRQNVWLTDGKGPLQVRGVAINSDDHVYTWYSDGQVTSGTSTDADAHRAVYKFTTPPGYSPSDILEVAIAADNDVYTWWADGTVSVGTSDDLDAHQPPLSFQPADNKTRDMIVGIGIGPNDVVYTWYSDGTRSTGSSRDLGSSSVTYQAPVGNGFIRGIDLAGNGSVYTWYSQLGTYKRTVGSLNNLGPAGLDVRLPADCDFVSTVHEIGHAVGLEHEQSRCDRGANINVFLDNVAPDGVHNFETLCGSSYDSFTSYDFASVMHYGSYAWSINGRPTLLGKGIPGEPLVGPIDMAIASDDHVYTWWSDGFVTAGTSSDLERFRARYPFTLPPGKSVSDIVGIAIAEDDRVYTYYIDNTVSIGTTDDLDAHEDPYEYFLDWKLPDLRYQPSEVVAIGISEEDHVYVWYSDGKGSWGTSDDLSIHGPYDVTSPLDPDFDEIVGIDISSEDTIYAWYASGIASRGESTNLDMIGTPYEVAGRGIEQVRATGLSALDIDGINAMY